VARWPRWPATRSWACTHWRSHVELFWHADADRYISPPAYGGADHTEEWLRLVSKPAPTRRMSAPMDFTALVMSRIEIEPTAVQPSVDASMRERAQAVAGTLAFAVLLVLASGAALIRFEPGLAFAALSAVVSGCVMMLVAIRTVSDSLYAVSSNNGLMLLVSGLLFVSLVLWSQIARSSGRVTREA